MPEYSSTSGGGGFTVNVTYNPATEIITTVVTAPNGSTATATTQRFVSEGGLRAAIPDLVGQLQASGALLAGARPNIALYNAVSDSTKDVIQQADRAARAAKATDQPVPDAPTPPASVAAADNPSPTTAPANPPVENTAPASIDNGAASQAEADAINNAIKNQQQAEAQAGGGMASQAEADAINNAIKNQQQAEDQAGGGMASSAEADAINNAIKQSAPASKGITASKLNTNSQATQQDAANAAQQGDWRVRLSLAPGADYLYKVTKGQAGILNPLQDTDGVIFPYTPSISVNYSASYDSIDLTHSNYKFHSYKSSSVDNITIGCDFTAQDTFEANYMLAVIHFFRSVTKMFYGQDQNPKPGTPPPLCYIYGLGAYQFDRHPIAITSFNYSLPSDVDYIRAGTPTTQPGVNVSTTPNNSSTGRQAALESSGLVAGGLGAPATFPTGLFPVSGTAEPTYVPTKIQISISAIPIITRNDISNKFSLKDYATGKLLRGSKNNGGGIW